MASHSEVAHRWAQDDENARTLTGFNMFCDQRPSYPELFAPNTTINTIYSHGRHYAAAAFVTTPAGERVVLVNTDRRSMSTMKHLSHIRRAIPSRYRVFHVGAPDPMHKAGGADHFHEDNLSGIVQDAAETFAKAKRARKYAGHHTDHATALLEGATAYAEAFGLTWSPPALEGLAAEVAARAEAKQAEYNRERAERQQRERERMEALRVTQAEDFAAWSAGEGYRVPSGYSADDKGAAYVRRYTQGDTDELQTSLGASVPWAHAVKAFRFIKLCKEQGKAWSKNGHVVRVGHYQVDSIDAEGNMHAGCHYFAWEHMEALAKRQGVFEQGSSADAVEVREHA